MGRLYDHEELISQNSAHIARNAVQISKISHQMQVTGARFDRLASMIATLSESVVRQAQEIESHEPRRGVWKANSKVIAKAAVKPMS